MKVIIAEDDPTDLFVYSKRLKDLGHIVICEVSSGKSLIAKSLIHKPELLLVDINLPHMSGIVASLKVKESLPDIKILCITGKDLKSYSYELSSSGINGYLFKETTKDHLQKAIESAMNGTFYLDERIGPRLLSNIGEIKKELENLRHLGEIDILNELHELTEPSERPITLTDRQVILVSAIYYGKKRKEINELLGVGLDAVNKAIRRLKDKYDLDSTAELVRLCAEHGLVKKDYELLVQKYKDSIRKETR